MPKLRNSAGFSLIEIMIAVGIAGGFAVILSQFMKNMNDSAKSIEIKMDALQFHSELMNTLLSEKGCNDALGSTVVDFAAANSESGQAVSLSMPMGRTFSSNMELENTSLLLKNITLHNPVDQSVALSDSKIYQAEMKYHLKTTVKRLGANDFKKSLGSYYITVDDSSNEVVGCSSELGVSYLCTKMNGSYDLETGECSVSPEPEDACEAIGGTFNEATDACNKFKYSDCAGLAHGQTRTTCSGSCSGNPGAYTYTKKLCLDSQLITIDTRSGRNTASCFIASTRVRMHDQSLKRIDEVKIGEKVIGEYAQINTVIGIERPHLGSRRLYSFNGDGHYFVTAEHPFKTTEGWKSFSPEMTALETDLEVVVLGTGDEILRFKKSPMLIRYYDKKHDEPDMIVYNLLLDGNNTYYADDYLVHNKP